MLLLNKLVDQSVLKEGFSIPVSYQKEILEKVGFNIPRGAMVPIRMDVGGRLFDAQLKNQKFDEKTYPTHGDLLQIRYPANGELSQMLRSVFNHTAARIEQCRLKGEKVRTASWPNEEKEYMALYATPVPGVIYCECVTNPELVEESSEIRRLDEQTAEQLLEREDPSAEVLVKTKLCKVRKMNRAIGNELKALYGYRCQICGQFIGERYGSQVIHAHHIDYFTRTMNNDADNILIVCPNHHSIIHDRNPVFDRRSKVYRYPNGYTEGLALNLHI